MPAEKDFDSLQMFLYYARVVWARKRLVIVILGLSILLGSMVAQLLPRVYQASCLIQVQPESPDIDSFTRGKPDQYDENFLRTQFELIQSDQVVEDVVRELNLTEILGREYGHLREDSDKTKVFNRTVKLVSSKIEVRQRKDTNLIEIAVKLDRPKKPKGQAAVLAARIANEVGKAFRNQTSLKSRETTKRALQELQREIKILEEQITEAQQQLDQVRQQYRLGNVELTEDGPDNAQEIRRVELARNQAELEMRKKRILLEQVMLLREQNEIHALALLARNRSLDVLVTEWNQLEIQHRSQLTSSLGPEHPRMKRLRARIEELGHKISEEMEGICIGLRADYDAARVSYNHLTEEVAKLRNRDVELCNGGYREYQELTRKLKALRERRNTWEENYIQERLKLRLPHTSVNIVQKAKQNQASSPVSPKVSLILAVSVVLGLMAGIGLVLLLEVLNTTVKNVDDVKYHLKTHVLGVIPRGVVHVNNPKTHALYSEHYRILRANIKSIKQDQESYSLCVCSGGAKEGKSQTLFNLAYVCAGMGDRVLIVDSDLHLPTQHEILQRSRHPGLANFLLGETSLAEVIQPTSLPNLDLLPAGRPRDETSGLHETKLLATALRDLKRRYEWILFDSPPMMGVSDAAELVCLTDGVVLVVEHRKYPRNLLRQVRERIDQLGGNLLGVVMNKVNLRRGDPHTTYHFNGYYRNLKGTKNKFKLWPGKQVERNLGA
jgi:succinoglycan biosynthesis transport protein ExoP